MARKTKKIALYFFEEGQISIRATDGSGKRFKTLEAEKGKICFKPTNEKLGKEIREILKNCI